MHCEVTEEMLSFIDRNPTAYHAVASIKEILRENGFEELLESRAWKLVQGHRYYVCRNSSSIIAFAIGSKLDHYSFNIASSHVDSPFFKIKELSEIDVNGKLTKLNTEGYGSMICSTWMDRPLSIAGRVIVRTEEGTLETRLLDFRRGMLLIPSVAIHMNRAVNDSASYNKQIDMLPLFGGKAEHGTLKRQIAEELCIREEQILGSDLYVYNPQKPSVWGCNDEFISSSRLDDQECVYASLRALIASENEHCINVMAAFDNEEVGSKTKQGADSTFLYDVLRRMTYSLGRGEEDYLRALSSSFVISADNAHAFHPNHQEYMDITNCTYMNEGVVVKFSASQSYSSDAVGAAVIRALAERAGVPLQFFANRSDNKGGRTLGNLSTSHVAVNTVDIGLPQLAMHSSYETAGVKDVAYMIGLVTEFYNTYLEEADSGILRIAG